MRFGRGAAPVRSGGVQERCTHRATRRAEGLRGRPRPMAAAFLHASGRGPARRWVAVRVPDLEALRPGDFVKVRGNGNPLHTGGRAVVVAVHREDSPPWRIVALDLRYSARGPPCASSCPAAGNWPAGRPRGPGAERRGDPAPRTPRPRRRPRGRARVPSPGRRRGRPRGARRGRGAHHLGSAAHPAEPRRRAAGAAGGGARHGHRERCAVADLHRDRHPGRGVRDGRRVVGRPRPGGRRPGRHTAPQQLAGVVPAEGCRDAYVRDLFSYLPIGQRVDVAGRAGTAPTTVSTSTRNSSGRASPCPTRRRRGRPRPTPSTCARFSAWRPTLPAAERRSPPRAPPRRGRRPRPGEPLLDVLPGPGGEVLAQVQPAQDGCGEVRGRGGGGDRAGVQRPRDLGLAPTGVATTGSPLAKASTVTIPKPSISSVGRTNRSAER